MALAYGLCWVTVKANFSVGFAVNAFWTMIDYSAHPDDLITPSETEQFAQCESLASNATGREPKESLFPCLQSHRSWCLQRLLKEVHQLNVCRAHSGSSAIKVAAGPLSFHMSVLIIRPQLAMSNLRTKMPRLTCLSLRSAEDVLPTTWGAWAPSAMWRNKASSPVC